MRSGVGVSEQTCIVIDSACDLPPDFIEKHQIEILPIGVRFGEKIYSDNRIEERTVSLYRANFDKRGIDAETVPYSVDQITELLATRVATKYDNALVITITSSRSPMYENTRKAAFVNLTRFRRAYRDERQNSYFSIRVMDSHNLFTGEAVLAWEAVRLLHDQGLALNKLTQPLEFVRDRIYSYLIPRDLYFIHKRGKKKGENSVGLVGYAIGSMLDVKPIIQAHRGDTEVIMKASGFDSALKKLLEHAMRQIKQGLATPVVIMSYAGDLSEIRNRPVIQQFQEYAAQHRVECLLSVMSTTAAINVGPGSFSLAFAAG